MMDTDPLGNVWAPAPEKMPQAVGVLAEGEENLE